MVKCEICGQNCDSERGLKIHSARKHRDNPTLSKKDKNAQLFKIPPQTYSVPLGTVLKLSGEIFCQDPETKAFTLTQSEGLSARVVHKEFQVQAGKTFLFCSVYRVTDRLWAILEEEVLNNKFPIISWGEGSSEMVFTPSAPTGDITMEDPFDPQERQSYLNAVEEYAKARDEKNFTEKLYVKVDAETRPSILEYLDKYGVETVSGKKDLKLVDGGWVVHYTNGPSTTFVERDEGRIVQWLIDNGADDCLRKILNVDAWEELKKSGLVPPEFIKEVEIPREKPATRKFIVERDAEKP